MALVKKKRRGPGPARPVHARTKIDRSKLEVLPIGADSRRFGIFADRRESSRDKLRKQLRHKKKERPFSRLRTHCRRDIFLLHVFGLRRHNTSRFPTRNRAPIVRRARLCTTHGRSARVAAVEASDSPRRRATRRASERAERTRAVARHRNARNVAWRAPACGSTFCSAGEAASRDEAVLIAAGARVRDRERPTRGLPSRFQQRPDSPRAPGPRAPPAAALYLPGVSPGESVEHISRESARGPCVSLSL